jgi:hypothetical protein
MSGNDDELDELKGRIRALEYLVSGLFEVTPEQIRATKQRLCASDRHAESALDNLARQAEEPNRARERT